VPVGGFADILFGPVQGCALALLSQVVPERACALAGSSANQTSIGGPDNPRRPGEGWFIYEFPWAGWPATADLDGNLGISNWYMGDLPSIWPVERGELALPLRVVYSGIRADSGGPGMRRGGNGLVRAWEVLAPGQFSFLGSEGIIPRAGMSGGYGAALNRLEVMRDGKLLELGEIPLKVGGFGLEEGDVIVTYAAGGAGYGDPLEREPERVAQDVRDGYVTVEGAADDYGVVLSGVEVDAESTEKRRAELRDARVRLTVEVTANDEFDDKGLRVARVSPAVAERLGAGEGDLIEFVPEARPSLRAWIAIDESAGDGLPIGPLGARACGVDSGDSLLVRLPWGHARTVSGFPPELEQSLELLRGIPA
jgi:N-methylhydantoinase B